MAVCSSMWERLRRCWYVRCGVGLGCRWWLVACRNGDLKPVTLGTNVHACSVRPRLLIKGAFGTVMLGTCRRRCGNPNVFFRLFCSTWISICMVLWLRRQTYLSCCAYSTAMSASKTYSACCAASRVLAKHSHLQYGCFDSASKHVE